MRATKRMDLTQGSVIKQMLAFAIPIMLGGILQQLYNVADRVVVGQFAENGEVALAAVGATSSATLLILGLFTGIAVGANVICANFLGAKQHNELRQSMHTSVLVAAISGVGVGLFGVLAAKWILELMDTPASVLADATLYMQIYFMGTPGSLVYNFSSGIMRAHGDTKRPMYILMVSGIANVVLNLVFVIGCGMGVEGVAVATIISQYISAIWALLILFNPKDIYQLRLPELKIHKKHLISVVRIGIPNGLGGMVFSLSNVIIQSSINSFDSAVIMAGKTAASDLAVLIYQVEAAMYATCVSFAGQCFDAREYKRIDMLMRRGIALLEGAYVILSGITTVFARQLIGLFNSNPEVIDVGVSLYLVQCWGYMLYAPAEICLGCLRGMKYSTMPTFLNLLGVCLPRLLWVWFVFPHNRTILFLFMCYPVSWIISTILQSSYYSHVRKKQNRELAMK